jgi:hypothetical protein
MKGSSYLPSRLQRECSNSSRIRLLIGTASSCSPSSSERKRKVRSKEMDSVMEADEIERMRADGETEIVKDKESLDIRMKRRSKVVDTGKDNNPSRAVVTNNKKKAKEFF